MAEETTPTTTTTTPDPPAPGSPKDEPKTVPYERFQEVNEQQKSLKQQLAEVQTKLREREEAEMSAVERERAAKERLEQQVNDLASQNARLSKGGWLVEEARKAGFADPTDAAALIDAGSIETEAQARRAVKDLAERKPHLVAQRQGPPEIGQILQGGEPVDPAQTTAEQLKAQARRSMNDDLREAAGIRPR